MRENIEKIKSCCQQMMGKQEKTSSIVYLQFTTYPPALLFPRGCGSCWSGIGLSKWGWGNALENGEGQSF